mgnify:CR=1 FL=1
MVGYGHVLKTVKFWSGIEQNFSVTLCKRVIIMKKRFSVLIKKVKSTHKFTTT